MANSYSISATKRSEYAHIISVAERVAAARKRADEQAAIRARLAAKLKAQIAARAAARAAMREVPRATDA
jgi:hypothetical protein